MGDQFEKARDSASQDDKEILLNGTPEQRLKAWLKLTKDESGHYTAGDWMSVLVPHLSLHSYNVNGPHPSATFLYTVQPDHCNRMQNLHGGCAATLFDWCTTLPLAMINKPGFWQFMGVSRTLNVTYLRPAPAGEQLLIEAEIVQVGKKMATLKGTMRRKSDGMVTAVCEHGKFNIDPEVKL